jgi:hypothetical protein
MVRRLALVLGLALPDNTLIDPIRRAQEVRWPVMMNVGIVQVIRPGLCHWGYFLSRFMCFINSPRNRLVTCPSFLFHHESSHLEFGKTYTPRQASDVATTT